MADPGQIAAPVELPLEREREPFWTWTDVVLFAVGAPLAIAGVAVLLLVALKSLHWPVGTALALLGMQSVLYIAGYGLLWLILMLRHSRSIWDALRWAVNPVTGGRLFAAGFVLAFAIALLGLALHTPIIDNPIMKLMRDPVSILAVVVFASTLGPAAEEAVFRGFLQPVATRTFGVAGGIAGTSLVFAALHGIEYQWCWQYLLLVFTASLAFGWARMRWNSTGASTLLHAGYNLMFFIGFLFQGRIFPTHG
jgi:hypothetical protein